MRKKQVLPLVLLILAVAQGGSAQIPDSQVVFAYLGLSIESPQLVRSLSDTDVQVLENRIRGYLLDIARQENYSLASPQNAAATLGLLRQRQLVNFREQLISYGSTLTANGVLFYQLDLDANAQLRLRGLMYSVPGAEIVIESQAAASNLDGLLAKLPGLVYELFGLAPPSSASDRVALGSNRSNVGAFSKDRELSLRDVAGTWQGDYDQAKVEIKPDGSGLIWLNQTDTMRVKVVVNGQSVSIRQDEPNSPKMYLSVFPYTIAVQVVRLARPMSWEFRVTPERDRLIGKKETSYFYIEQSKVVQVDNTYSRDAVWTRIP